MKVVSLGLLCLGIAAFACAEPALASPFSPMQYLLGDWNCSTKTNEGVSKGSAHYEMAMNNAAIAMRFDNPEYVGSGYLVFDKKAGLLVTTLADAYGGSTRESGTATADGTLAMHGIVNYGSPAPMRESITKTQDGFRDLDEMQQGGKWTLVADSTCTRAN
ncbi:MAG TPA: hypothetical protein VGN11_07485 [Candidatus Baltobacteraceae bacterium]|jgi:hypothetical protein|nr:hypothetical protein [Candidatus Baltobacteraceae bacterium]